MYASNGVTDGVGSFGYVLYIRPEEYDRVRQLRIFDDFSLEMKIINQLNFGLLFGSEKI